MAGDRFLIAGLGITGTVSAQQAEKVVLGAPPAVLKALSACDDRYYGNDGDIAGRLFAWIRENRALIRVGNP